MAQHKRKRGTKKNINRDELINKIDVSYTKSMQSGGDSMRLFIDAGEQAVKLKEQVNHGDFIEIIKSRLSHIDVRQLQRAMRLFKACDFFNHEALYFAPRAHLEKIIKKSGKIGVIKFLEVKNVNLDIDPEEPGDLQDFLEAIKNLATQSSNSPPKIPKKTKDNDNDANGGDEDTNSESPPDSQAPKITFKVISSWVDKLIKLKKKTEKNLSVKQTASMKMLISKMRRLVDEFGMQDEE